MRKLLLLVFLAGCESNDLPECPNCNTGPMLIDGNLACELSCEDVWCRGFDTAFEQATQTARTLAYWWCGPEGECIIVMFVKTTGCWEETE